jgi:hypothetical protein
LQCTFRLPLLLGIVAVILNGVTYAVRPEGPFFPGFILSAVTASLICGMNTLRAFAPLRKKYFR